jgi:hypothetical protein
VQYQYRSHHTLDCLYVNMSIEFTRGVSDKEA